MAYMTTTAKTAGLTDRIRAAFSTLVERQRQRRLYRETYNGLYALSDRELDDLGLTRGELHDVSRDAASRG